MSDTDSQSSYPLCASSNSGTGSTGLLDQWFEIHPLLFEDSEWENKDFNNFMATLKYPAFASSEQAVKLLDAVLPEDLYLQSKYYTYKLTEPDKQIEDGDRYSFQTWFMYILGSWLSFDAYSGRNRGSPASRKGVDNVIELAFRSRKQMWLPDEDLVLPDEPDAVRADSIIAMDLPETWRRCGRVSSNLHYNLSWSYRNKPESIITFILISLTDDPDEALERLMMCFYSAQMHRRAICCRDGPVFGATLAKDKFQMYVAFWEGQTLKIQKILRRFSFGCFSSLVEVYFALCRISEYQAEFIEKEFGRWEENDDSHVDDLDRVCEKPWRKKERGEMESFSESYDEDDRVDEGSAAGASRVRVVNDRKTMQIIGSIRRGIFPSGERYRLTKAHKLAFDILTNLTSGEVSHNFRTPSTWAEEIYRYKDEYGDPSPYLSDEDNEGDSLEEPRDEEGSCDEESCDEEEFYDDDGSFEESYDEVDSEDDSTVRTVSPDTLIDDADNGLIISKTEETDDLFTFPSTLYSDDALDSVEHSRTICGKMDIDIESTS